MNKIYQKPFPSEKTAGFTLIELLVVVLIIGILAGIALPQYEKAVAKSRFVQLQTAGKSLKEAVELYYLANGQYPARWDWTDADFGGCREAVQNEHYLWCPSFAADLYWYNDKNILLYDVHGAPNHGDGMDGSRLRALPQATWLTLWLDHSAKPGKTECSSKISGLCQSMGYEE